MNILYVHNYYRRPGGEDVTFSSYAVLLREHGHRVDTYVDDNRRIDAMSPFAVAARAVWSRSSKRKLTRLLRDTRFDVAHFHNTFVLISPSAYYACGEQQVPVVQELPNYRLFCLAATFSRDRRPCEDCLRRLVPWPGMLHGCYQGSRTASAGVAAMLTVHRLMGTWTTMVDVYVALTEFGRRKFIEGGLPADKIVVKPNCVYPDPGVGDHAGRYGLFVGRLSNEKGLHALLDAWGRLRRPALLLKVVGSGPLESLGAASPPGVEWLGQQPKERVLALMKDASFLVLPSEWYEGFPMTLAEAFATGLPVIASRLGAMGEILEDGRTGLHFRPGDPDDLASRLEWAMTRPASMAEMGRRARREFEAKYTAERNYEMLMDIYGRAMRRAKERR
jgi:glycosyltransferase involved in cell wall biosynthesis